jgi:hypothetical protein
VLITLLQHVMLYSEVLHFVSCMDHCLVKVVPVYLYSRTRLSVFFYRFIRMLYDDSASPEIVDSTFLLLEWSEETRPAVAVRNYLHFTARTESTQTARLCRTLPRATKSR